MNDHHAIEIVELNSTVVGTDTARSDPRMNDTFTPSLDRVRSLIEEAPSGYLDGTSFCTIHGIDPNAQEPEIQERSDAAVGPDTAGSDARVTVEELNDTVTRCLDRVRSLLDEAPSGFLARTLPHTIFRICPPLRWINPKANKPEMVSIGPYHRDQPQVLAFEQLKPLFLKRFLRRTQSNLELLTRAAAGQASSARTRYSEDVDMTSDVFVQMMLLDGCFVLALLLHFFKGDDATDEDDGDKDDPIFTRPHIIPILIGDLLKLENQIPYSLLQSLFGASCLSELIGETDSLATLALKLFDQVYSRPMAHLKAWGNLECEHLLDLFYSSLSPASEVHLTYTKEKWPSAQSVPCVTELRSSGIKFKSRKADSLLDKSFRKPVLQIPHMAINDFMTTVLINCVSLEQCRENRSKYMTDYVSFMHCLINQPKDVFLLRSDGIIALFSHDDQYVANLFDKLGKSISFNVHDCFLAEQFQELESYYHSNWANMMRTYFSSPWSFISALLAFLAIVLSITQTVFAILTYHYHH
ncbi:UPF0481 protein At3g47200-like [Syzygium oleosum]|uniref:UPF0481 protein At3g47200-like n=1 Tax=Syzygium oleosum TaxID=219896 RepID=UPI0011D289C5|nr:UPF0481 protein At3g47200-like [Syzygium oleosum]